MTKVKATLIQKDPLKGTAPNTVGVENINIKKGSRGLFPEEQKAYCKATKGIGELLYIAHYILSENKTRRKNIAMAWIDYKKAYDMVP